MTRPILITVIGKAARDPKDPVPPEAIAAADAVIMISGGIGTLNELTVAYEDKPTVILEGTGGWADRIREVAYEGKHLDEAHRATLYFAKTPAEAVELALQLAQGGNTGD